MMLLFSNIFVLMSMMVCSFISNFNHSFLVFSGQRLLEEYETNLKSIKEKYIFLFSFTKKVISIASYSLKNH